MTFRPITAGAAAVLALTSLPTFVPTAAAADWAFSGNAGLFSDYRFRGISQTHKKPAFQGGFDLAHASGFYVGNWNSNIDASFYGGSNLEMDFYGGFKGAVDAFSYDVGVLYYYYPGSDPKIDNTELYIGGGWGPLSVKYSYAVSDFFSLPESDGSWYLDTKLAYPLSKEMTLIARVGYQSLNGSAQITEIDGSGPKDSITDWALGVTYDMSGWLLGASYIGTNRDVANAVRDPNRNLSNDTFVVSVSKSF
ncbi:MAG: TorF family putative porin [Rubrivivax sp.]|nr:TorF family putative porin [Rubrivivax sp.]